MGCTPSKFEEEGEIRISFSMPTPVPDHHEAEKTEEHSSDGDGYDKFKKDHDDQVEHSSSETSANLSTWSKVNKFFTKFKPSFKSNQGNARKSISSDSLQEEEANKVCHRKSVDQAFYFEAVNMKDVEQLVNEQVDPRAGIWQRVTRGVKVADESFSLPHKPPLNNEKSNWRCRAPPGGEDRVVLYFTSLRGIRKTFNDCSAVKLILCGFRVLVDERDISMHNPFRLELEDLLGKPITLPRLFIAGKYIGGIEEIMQLHEARELAKYLEGFPRHTCYTSPCQCCDDSRFVPCPNCDGSRKIYSQKLGGQFQGQVVWMRCLQCNENGLIRCPLCCVDAAFAKP